MITASQWKRHVLPLLDDPATWGWRNKLAYRRPVDWVLLGVLAEGSGFQRDRAYVWEVHMPLFVPHESVWLTHGDRVPHGARTVGLDEPEDFVAVVRQALARVPSQADALAAISRSNGEEGAYALLLLGQVDLAERRLAEPFWPDAHGPHLEEARRRRGEVAGALQAGGPGAAVDLLRSWRDATMASIGIS
ncbi:MAG: hypothetical protein U0P45_03500 [Acidimicrobiales bacterium]